MTQETLMAQGPVERNVREHIGYCPVCETNTPSLPNPAEGTCSYCMNHLMKACDSCANFKSARVGNLIVGMDRCKGAPDKREYDPRWARRNENLCGAGGAWAVFPNA